MSSIFTKNFGVLSAKNFERFISSIYGNVYLMFGRQKSWGNPDTPPTPIDTANTFYDVWDNAIGLKKINAADMNLVIPRVDWNQGTRYVEYNQDLDLFYKNNSANVAYDNSFYVRNNRDQVFKCLFNNANSNSTIMPEISIGGQLPENAYITTSDGYRWKYMYTIPAGLKEKFFTSQYMPVVSDATVSNSAVFGRIDIVKIVTPGSGFNANNNSNSYNILTVVGDGSNANLTARVTTTAPNGANITGYNIIDAGQDYTRATISIQDPLKISNTQSANLIVVIGPPGGHGSDPEQELGASHIMISVELEGNENGIFPVKNGSSPYRQVTLLKDPQLANTAYATGSLYRATTKLSMTQPNKNFLEGETVYVGATLNSASFSAVVENYNSSTFDIYLNNTFGSISAPATLTGATSGAIATVLLVTTPDIKKYTGDLLYIENNLKIERTVEETQQFKLTLRF